MNLLHHSVIDRRIRVFTSKRLLGQAVGYCLVRAFKALRKLNFITVFRGVARQNNGTLSLKKSYK
jgi:hypothetical protein